MHIKPAEGGAEMRAGLRSHRYSSITFELLESSIIMSSQDIPFAFGKRPKAYDEGEREAIDKYKVQYMQTTSPSERKALAQGKIFPDLFNVWADRGIVLDATEKNMREEVSEFTHNDIYK